MSNTGEYYDHLTYPATGAAGSSAAMRAELDSIEAGLNKLPAMATNGGKLVKVAASADNLEVSAVISDDGTDATIAGDLYVTGGQIGQNSGQKHTIPAVASDTLALLAAAQTLTNKIIVAANNTITTASSGNLTATELNAALAELQGDIDTRATISSPTFTGTVTTNGDITSSGGVIGYGTGAGGTVTQLTSKSTGVTLNKPSGQITMHNAALAAGATVTFALTSSSISAADSVVTNAKFAGGNYQVWVTDVAAGVVYISVKNNSAGSLSDAVLINFAVLNGSTS